jgi:ribosomal protein S18 acetylase RimI-like enzyme
MIMSAITSTLLSETPQLRPLNILRDLPHVADLVETCFSDTMDAEGQRFIQQMRRAGQDNQFLRWATSAVESASMPLSGYVWEENDTLVGNVSLIPYRDHGQKIYLIANVAVHPDYRRRGIARLLTSIALDHTWRRKAEATWLHVRDDNPGALKLYTDLGFEERARRTHWQASPNRNLPNTSHEFEIRKRSTAQWPRQKEWLQRLYPEQLSWYQPTPWSTLHPGVLFGIYRFFMETETRTWAITDPSGLVATLSWLAVSGRSGALWAALPAGAEVEPLATLLSHARRVLAGSDSLSLDLPGGVAVEAAQSAGFQARRTLIWMRADKTSVANVRR